MLLHGALALARWGCCWKVLSPGEVLSQCLWKPWVWLSGLSTELESGDPGFSSHPSYLALLCDLELSLPLSKPQFLPHLKGVKSTPPCPPHRVVVMIPGDKVGESSLNSPQVAAHLGGPALTLCNHVRKDTAP